MGVMTIDIGIGTRLDDLAKVAFEIYYRGMTLASEIEKSSARIAKVKKAEIDPSLPPYSTADETSFASKTVKERWPVLLTKTIADIQQTMAAEQSAGLRTEGESIIRELESLKWDMESNRLLRLIPDDGEPNVVCYNEELRRLHGSTWRNVSWLFSECYLYRLLHAFFMRTTHWKNYDPFFRQKDEAFKTSKSGVFELAEHFREFASTVEERSRTEKPVERKLVFEEMTQICLWGNASDLSFSLQGDATHLQEKYLRADANKNILVNDLESAWAAISKLNRARVDIVLDNSGFELFADLIFTLYLLSTGIAETVILHPKSIPWFVSDVTPNDIGHLFAALSNPQYFGSGQRHSAIDFLVERLTDYYSDGRIIIRSNDFWTTQHSYWRLPTKAPGLLADLEESDLVIFKGDLNYRKLTGDVMWPETTSFKQAIGPMAEHNLRLLALRTCKADVAVGLEQSDVDRLKVAMPDWRVNGKCAIISFHDNKHAPL